MTTNDLEIAIDSGNLSDIRKARQEGLDINILSRSGNPMFYNAVLRMSKPEHEEPLLAVMKELIKFPNFDINQKNISFGFSALSLAVRENKLHFAYFFLENGADVNVLTKAGKTPIIEACENRNMEAINLLMKYKPKLDIMDNLGESALTSCMRQQFVPGFDLLLDKSDITAVHKSGQPRIYSLCASTNSEMCQKFCFRGQELGVLDVLRQQLDVVKEKYTNGPSNYFYEVKMHINALQMREKMSVLNHYEPSLKKSIKI